MASQATNPFATNPFAAMDFSKPMDFSKLMDFGKVNFSDFGKFSEQFKFPGVDNKALAEAQRKNVEAFQAANQAFFEGAQAVTQRQSEIMRRVMEDSVKAVQSIAAADTPEAKFGKQAEVVKAAYETSVANWRELAELTTKSNSEAAEVISKRVSESMDELTSALKPANGKAVSTKK